MTPDVLARAGDAPRLRAQRRALTVLVAAQVLSGVGLAAGVTVGALLAQDLLGSTGLAGLPSAVGTAGSALAAVAVGRLSQARGRRPGLAAGYLAGAAGSAGVLAAAVAGSPVLLFLALFLYGAGTATTLQARYAGADLAAPAGRARAVSVVLVATTLGGVAGPNLAAPTGGLARALGIPYLAGPFLLAGVAYALAALVLAGWLRPDPLLLARTLETAPPAPPPAPTRRPDGPRGRPNVPGDRLDGSGDRPGGPGGRSRGAGGGGRGAGVPVGVPVGVLVMVLTQLVMVAIMTMTPVHMAAHGHGTAASGLVIAVHIGAMYLPSPLTGWLADRHGRPAAAAASGVALLAAGLVAAAAPGDSAGWFAVALALLGLGWNLGLVTGTAIITDAAPAATRARTQGSVDVAVAVAGAAGGLLSGLVVAVAGFPVLAAGGGLLALAVVPAAVAAGRRR
ncbi:MFS transporter [Actinomadura sp. ATCC 31491]|uniref:MFS transporter n=1 Tax=Actinomadura luzonensis TaxID=2805427 RepID=A0ABT0G480_9ACTN|nr:MFS transporter [Actinomadura luzonensis]MCK2219407.1 MFS transporter [Actinomadura luzonensis]